MLTYYKELEIPTKVTFPTLTLNSNHKNIARSLPVSYVAKYESLFNKLKTLHFQLNNLEQKESCFLSFDLDEDYYFLKTLIQQRKREDFFELESQVILSEETSLSKQDNYFDFQWYITVLKLLMKLYPNNHFYQTLFMELRQALKELSSFSDFSYIQEKKPVVLPNAWYITPLGELYNTGDGHKETNLEYPFKRVERLFMSAGNQVCFEAIINSLQKRYLEIKKNQCVSYADCSKLLNYNGYFISLGNVDVKSI